MVADQCEIIFISLQGGYTMLSSDFIVHFSKLEDPRVTNHNFRHKFFDILTMAFIATLCGCDDWVEVKEFCESKQELFKQILELPNGVPSHDTFARVFSLIDGEHFEELFSEWMRKLFVKTRGEIIAIDGKTIRGSKKQGQHRGIHLVSAWACENKLTLASVKVDDKSNEITAIPKLLKYLDITNCTITIDAIGCQKSIASTIVKNGGNYVLCVKNNQKELHGDISTAFKIVEKRLCKKFTENKHHSERNHGRTELRDYSSLPLDEFPHIRDNWPEAKSITKVVRTRIIDDEESVQTNYYISSHPYLSEQIHKGIRRHWNIENNLHWQLDISFNEDLCRARVRNAASNFALLRKISMGYLKSNKSSKVGIKCKRKKASWDDKFLFSVLAEGASPMAKNCKQ